MRGVAQVVMAEGVEILDFYYWISIGLGESFTKIYWKATFEKCHQSSFLGVGGGGGCFCNLGPLSVIRHQGCIIMSIFAFGLQKDKEKKIGGGGGRGGGNFGF